MDKNENIERTNPFFESYNTPHDTAPFDRIRMEDYEEAMLEGIRRDDEQIEKIINNPEKPTFDIKTRSNKGISIRPLCKIITRKEAAWRSSPTSSDMC